MLRMSLPIAWILNFDALVVARDAVGLKRQESIMFMTVSDLLSEVA